MLLYARPAVVDLNLLDEELRQAGIPSTTGWEGDDVALYDLDEADRPAADAVMADHPANAQADADRRATEATSEASIRDRAAAALTTNNDFLALTNPTNAQNAAQIKALTRQNNGLIRLALRRFDAAT